MADDPDGRARSSWPRFLEQMPYEAGTWWMHPWRKAFRGFFIAGACASLGVVYGEVTQTPAAARPFLITAILLSSWFGGVVGGVVGTLVSFAFFLLYSAIPQFDIHVSRNDAWFFLAFTAAAIVINLFNLWRRTIEIRMVALSWELLQEREHLEALFRSEVAGVVEVDRNAKFLRVNDRFSEIVGRSREELLAGMSCYDVTHSEHLPEMERCITELAQGASHFKLEKRYMRPNGEAVWAHNGVTAVRGPSGELVSAFAIVTDITEQKMAELRIKESLAIKDRFLGLISHELRTPIATIKGNAYLLKNRSHLLHPAAVNQVFEDLTQESDRLHVIVENLLILTRTESELPAPSAPVLLDNVISSAISKLNLREPERRVLFDKSGHHLVLGEEHFLAHVLENLLSNASKYSPPGQEIEVTVVDGNRSIEVHVLDRGSGVRVEDREEIFQPFFRAKSPDPSIQGMGLGLAACKRLAELMGGSISVWPREGGGSDFILTLRPAMRATLHEGSTGAYHHESPTIGQENIEAEAAI